MIARILLIFCLFLGVAYAQSPTNTPTETPVPTSTPPGNIKLKFDQFKPSIRLKIDFIGE